MSIRIWWDESVQAYRVVTPYRPQFVDALKQLLPASDRSWDNQTKTWTITERFLGPVQNLAEKAFGAKATVITKDQAQKASMPPTVRSSTVDTVIVEFFKLLPYEALQKAYRQAAMTLHPDRGGNMESMSKLNASWQRLEKEFFNK